MTRCSPLPAQWDTFIARITALDEAAGYESADEYDDDYDDEVAASGYYLTTPEPASVYLSRIVAERLLRRPTRQAALRLYYDLPEWVRLLDAVQGAYKATQEDEYPWIG